MICPDVTSGLRKADFFKVYYAYNWIESCTRRVQDLCLVRMTFYRHYITILRISPSTEYSRMNGMTVCEDRNFIVEVPSELPFIEERRTLADVYNVEDRPLPVAISRSE